MLWILEFYIFINQDQTRPDRRSQYEITFSHLLDAAVPTPFATELPPIKTGQHLDAEHTVQIVSRQTERARKSKSCINWMHSLNKHTTWLLLLYLI